MNIFILAGDLPSASHTVRAANKVLHSLAAEFFRQGHGVTLQPIFSGQDRRPWTEAEVANVAEAESIGIKILPPLFRSDYTKPLSGRASRAYTRFFNSLVHFYPALRLRPVVARRIRECNAHVALIFWNPEGLAATYQNHSLPKIAYYGMPDHAAALARVEDSELFDLHLPPLARVKQKQNLWAMERRHLTLMRDCDVVANLCAEHAEYYRRNGHLRSLYMPNVWPESPNGRFADPFALPPDAKPKILGNLGRPSATGNTYGLKYIGEQIVPRLNAVLGPDGYEIHIFGEGEPLPAVRKVLQAPAVKVRGWVEDIDGEICSSHVFLVANNTGPYRGSHTRFLHGWSLKACCVGHSYNARANPEMMHMDNVLLGETPDEMATLILKAITDPTLRGRIGEGGWQTYRTHFTPPVVAGRLLAEMESLVRRPAA